VRDGFGDEVEVAVLAAHHVEDGLAREQVPDLVEGRRLDQPGRDEEVDERPDLKESKGRLVLRFRVSPKFRTQARLKWGGVQKHGKAYKSLEEIEEEQGEEAA